MKLTANMKFTQTGETETHKINTELQLTGTACSKTNSWKIEAELNNRKQNLDKLLPTY